MKKIILAAVLLTATSSFVGQPADALAASATIKISPANSKNTTKSTLGQPYVTCTAYFYEESGPVILQFDNNYTTYIGAVAPGAQNDFINMAQTKGCAATNDFTDPCGDIHLVIKHGWGATWTKLPTTLYCSRTGINY